MLKYCTQSYSNSIIVVNPMFLARSCDTGGIPGLQNPQSRIQWLGKPDLACNRSLPVIVINLCWCLRRWSFCVHCISLDASCVCVCMAGHWWIQELVVGVIPFLPLFPSQSSPAAEQLGCLDQTWIAIALCKLSLQARTEPSRQTLFYAFWVQKSLLVVTVRQT